MRRTRLLEALPIFAALAVHGVAVGRWALVVPAAFVVLGFIASGRHVEYRSGRLMLAGLAGAGLGALLLLLPGVERFGPLPPVVLNPICGLMVGVSVYCALSRRLLLSWTWAWILAVLSETSRDRSTFIAALVMCLASFVAAAATSRFRARVDLRSSAGWIAFVLLLLGSTWETRQVVWNMEGTVMGLLMQWVGDHRVDGFGVSRTLSGGAIAESHLSARPLFEVSGDVPRKLRTTIFDEFDGLSWHTSDAMESTGPKLETGRPTGTLDLEFIEDLAPQLPAPVGALSVEGVTPRVIGGWVLQGDTRKESSARITFGPPLLPQEEVPGPRDLFVPDVVRRQLEPFARQMVAGARTPEAQAAAVERYLVENFEYSLNVDLTTDFSHGEVYPLTVLLRDRRPAFCAYFASAMAAVMRVLGVPARVVGGYVPEEKNPLSSHVTVRERDAHAWVEVYLPDQRRYVAFDPTPWRLRDQALGIEPRLGLLAGALDALLRGFPRLIRHPVATLLQLIRSPAVWVLLALAALRVFWRRTRAPRPVRVAALESDDLELRAARRRFIAFLRTLDVRPTPAETDDELAARVEAVGGAEVAGAVRSFLRVYRSMRFRGDAVSRSALDRSLADVKAARITRRPPALPEPVDSPRGPNL